MSTITPFTPAGGGGGGLTDGTYGSITVSGGGTSMAINATGSTPILDDAEAVATALAAAAQSAAEATAEALAPKTVETTVDFGVGNTTTTTTVTGQTWVTAASVVVPEYFGTTSDHDPEDWVLEEMTVLINNLVAGVGFDVVAFAPFGTHGIFNVRCVGV